MEPFDFPTSPVDDLSQILDQMLAETTRVATPIAPVHHPFLDPDISCQHCLQMSRMLTEQLQTKCLKSALKNDDALLTIQLAAIDAWQQVSCDNTIHLGLEHFDQLLACAVESLRDQTYTNELMFLRVCVGHNKTRCSTCLDYRTIRVKKPIITEQRILRVGEPMVPP